MSKKPHGPEVPELNKHHKTLQLQKVLITLYLNQASLNPWIYSSDIFAYPSPYAAVAPLFSSVSASSHQGLGWRWEFRGHGEVQSFLPKGWSMSQQHHRGAVFQRLAAQLQLPRVRTCISTRFLGDSWAHSWLEALISLPLVSSPAGTCSPRDWHKWENLMEKPSCLIGMFKMHMPYFQVMRLFCYLCAVIKDNRIFKIYLYA